ncbi:hypothetical protein [Pseudomonas oryzihabitans]|uniref:hypothetical protein n=1 Tax=Pseudomonas oryzihabitans TaxID=47885 RepID=UPI001ABFD285|nr:hypothetical protein [Pseudomonas oryzihabitans]
MVDKEIERLSTEIEVNYHLVTRLNMGSSNRSTNPRSFKRPRNPGIKLTGPFALIGVIVNGLITGAGYLSIAGYLNYYRINIVEAELPLSSYLFYGYIYVLDWWNFLSGSSWLAVSIFIVVVTLLMWFVLKKCYPARSNSNNILIAYGLGSLICISPAFPIITAYQHGKDMAHRELRSDFNGFGLQASKAVKTYYLEGGEMLVGWSLFTGPKVAWIVVDDSIYKINTFDRNILLRIDYDKIRLPEHVVKAEQRFWQAIAENHKKYIFLKNFIFR